MRTLLALVLALWCGISEAAVFNNSFTTNSSGKLNRPKPTTTSPLFPMMTLNPGGVGADLDIAYSPSFFMSNTFAYFPTGATNGYVFTTDSAGKATWQPGIAAGSTGTVNTLPKWTSTNALGDSRAFDNGVIMSLAYASNAPVVLSGITNSTDVIGIGDFALDSLVGDGLLNIYGIGPNALAGTTLAPFSSQIFAYGESALSGATLTNAVHIYAFGESSGANMTGDGMDDIYMIGRGVMQAAFLTNGSGGIYATGDSALDSAVLDGVGGIYTMGDSALSNAQLTNSSDIYAIGQNAGANLAGIFTHIFLIGSGATATTNNQWVAGDASYLYQFPGVEATFGGFVALSGTTNQYTDDGSTLLRNGVAISGSSETTATNVVTLTQTGTNLTAALNFALVARGGAFKITLTNNLFIGTPSGVATSPFSKAWIFFQQPATGTCQVTWTNGSFAAPEGVMPLVDTNNGSVAIVEMVSDVFSNGLVHISMTPLSKRVP